MHNFLGLGIGIGRFVLILVCFYFVVKLAVKKGIEEYYKKRGKNHQIISSSFYIFLNLELKFVSSQY